MFVIPTLYEMGILDTQFVVLVKVLDGVNNHYPRTNFLVSLNGLNNYFHVHN